jgi:hypothetical protein
MKIENVFIVVLTIVLLGLLIQKNQNINFQEALIKSIFFVSAVTLSVLLQIQRSIPALMGIRSYVLNHMEQLEAILWCHAMSIFLGTIGIFVALQTLFGTVHNGAVAIVGIYAIIMVLSKVRYIRGIRKHRLAVDMFGRIITEDIK